MTAPRKPRAKKIASLEIVPAPEVAAPEVIASIKGFDLAMQCRGFQFETGKTYTCEGPIEACANGFHAIEGYPLEVFDYYPPGQSRYAETAQTGALARHTGDSKIASAVITIGVEIHLHELIQRAVRWVFDRSKPEGETAPGDRGAASSTGDRGAASSTGDRGAASSTGFQGAASSTGDRGAASSTGDRGAASSTGDRGAALSTGYQGAASSTGYRGAASSTGNRGAASSTGNRGAASSTGNRGAASSTGNRGAASSTGDQGAASSTGDQGAASSTGDQGQRRARATRVQRRARATGVQQWLPDIMVGSWARSAMRCFLCVATQTRARSCTRGLESSAVPGSRPTFGTSSMQWGSRSR